MNDVITLDHGSGGRKTSELIEGIMLPAFGDAELYKLSDGATLPGDIVFSTDSFVISPYFFPGGNIGKLAVCGTVNDISVSGGIPRFLSLSFILEEGLPIDDLKKIVSSIAETAKPAGVRIVTGDTKVVEKGRGDGIYINTAGIGTLSISGLSAGQMAEGDAVLVSGPIGGHGIAVMLARNPGLIGSDVLSDCAPVNKIAESLFTLGSALKVMRDPTRGGVATTLCEFLEHGDCENKPKATAPTAGGSKNAAGLAPSGLGIELYENAVSVAADVAAACDILGLDPLYSACEGRLLAVVSQEKAEEALALMRAVPGAEGAQCIGTVTTAHPGKLVLNTAIGGSRILAKLSGNQFPRIC